MNRKIANIIRLVNEKFEYDIQCYEEYHYEMKFGEGKVFIDFEITSDVIRYEISFLFGIINHEKQIDVDCVLEMLKENTNTFQKTSAYLSAVDKEGSIYLLLNSYHQYLAKWDDIDIAEMLGLQLLDIKLAFINWDYPDTVYCFKPE